MPQCVIGSIKIHIEVPLLLLFFAFTFADSITTNLIIFRTCYVTLRYSKEECARLGTNNKTNETERLEKIVEPYAAVLNTMLTSTEALISAIECLFVGTWSHRFGRRPFLILPPAGFMLFYVLFAFFAAVDEMSPWYSLICSIPVYLCGGPASYLTVLLCYISDVTDERNRGMKMGVFEAVLAFGSFLGNISSSYVFLATSYPVVYLIAASCCFLALIFTLYFVPESLENPETEGRFRSFFQIAHVKEMIKITFKRRPNYDRYILLSCILMMTLMILMINGDGALIFLYLRQKFGWSLEQYTAFNAAQSITLIVGTVMGTYLLHKLLKIKESIMIIIGFISMFIGVLFMGLAKSNWQIYGASFLRSLGGVLSPMVRSLVSKIVPSEEVGRIFALIVTSESLIGMGGSPIFTAIYNMTLATNSAIFNFVSAVGYLVEILIAASVIYFHTAARSEVAYQEVVEENFEPQQDAIILERELRDS